MKTVIRKTAFTAALVIGCAAAQLSQAQGGMLHTWGNNDYGQLTNTPVGNDFISVSSQGAYAVAVRKNGTLASWGYNANGQVSNTPAGGGFVAAWAGYGMSTALKSDGTLVSWGDDGQAHLVTTSLRP